MKLVDKIALVEGDYIFIYRLRSDSVDIKTIVVFGIVMYEWNTIHTKSYKPMIAYRLYLDNSLSLQFEDGYIETLGELIIHQGEYIYMLDKDEVLEYIVANTI